MIVHAKPEHLQSINDIYNQAVNEGLRTAHTNPISLAERKTWFQHHSRERFPIFVYLEKSSVLGWISVSPYRSGREALDEVIEVSYYVDYEHHGQKIATKLMQYAVDFCRQKKFRILVAILISGNEPSIKLLEKFNFCEGGRIPDAIHYKKVFRDHLYMYKKLDP